MKGHRRKKGTMDDEQRAAKQGIPIFSFFSLSKGWNDNVSQGEGGVEEVEEEKEVGWLWRFRMKGEGERGWGATTTEFGLQSAIELQLQTWGIARGECCCYWQKGVSARGSRKERCNVMSCYVSPSLTHCRIQASDRAWFACCFVVARSVCRWFLSPFDSICMHFMFALRSWRFETFVFFSFLHGTHGSALCFAVHAQQPFSPLTPQP